MFWQLTRCLYLLPVSGGLRSNSPNLTTLPLAFFPRPGEQTSFLWTYQSITGATVRPDRPLHVCTRLQAPVQCGPSDGHRVGFTDTAIEIDRSLSPNFDHRAPNRLSNKGFITIAATCCHAHLARVSSQSVCAKGVIIHLLTASHVAEVSYNLARIASIRYGCIDIHSFSSSLVAWLPVIITSHHQLSRRCLLIGSTVPRLTHLLISTPRLTD